MVAGLTNNGVPLATAISDFLGLDFGFGFLVESRVGANEAAF